MKVEQDNKDVWRGYWRIVAHCFAIVWAVLFVTGQFLGKNTDFQFTLMVIHVIWWRMETKWAENKTDKHG